MTNKPFRILQNASELKSFFDYDGHKFKSSGHGYTFAQAQKEKEDLKEHIIQNSMAVLNVRQLIDRLFEAI
jgi:hypothetical protein